MPPPRIPVSRPRGPGPFYFAVVALVSLALAALLSAWALDLL